MLSPVSGCLVALGLTDLESESDSRLAGEPFPKGSVDRTERDSSRAANPDFE
jgi:hypothetical protein